MAALSRKSYREKALALERHHAWVNMVACKPGIGSPYAAPGVGDDGVYITAVVEHFDVETVYEVLANFVNQVCLNVRDSWLTQRLRAVPMEDGVQLWSTYNQSQSSFVQSVKEACEYGALLPPSHYELGDDTFFDECQIRCRTLEPFGATTASIVQIVARSNVPLRLMLELLREFWLPACNRHCGLEALGQITLVDTQGLPDSGKDHLFWSQMPSLVYSSS